MSYLCARKQVPLARIQRAFSTFVTSLVQSFRKVLDIIRAQEEIKDLHDQFHHQVSSTEYVNMIRQMRGNREKCFLIMFSFLSLIEPMMDFLWSPIILVVVCLTRSVFFGESSKKMGKKMIRCKREDR